MEPRQSVDAGVIEGTLKRTMHIYVCCLVVHIFGALALKYRPQLLASNVDLVELGLGVDIVLAARGEVIDDNNLVPGFNQRVDYVGPYEPRSTGDKNATHIMPLTILKLTRDAGNEAQPGSHY